MYAAQTGHASGASAVPGCPLGIDLWFAYLPQEAIDLRLLSFQSSFSVYVVPGGVVGECPAESERIECQVEEALVQADAGDLILIQCGDFIGSFLNLSYGPVPDRCVTANPIESLPHTFTQNFPLLGAEPGFTGCPAVADMWSVYDASEDGSLVFQTSSLFDDHGVSVYRRSITSGPPCPLESELVLCDVSSGVVEMTAGDRIWFRHTLRDELARSAYAPFTVDRLDPLPNDECEDALPIEPFVEETVEMWVATPSAEPPSCGSMPDAWYTWTADVGGPMVVVADPGVALTVSVTEGTCEGSEISCGYSPIEFEAVTGEMYRIRIGSPQPAIVQTITLRRVYVPPPDARYELSVPDLSVPEGAEVEIPVVLSFGDATPAGEPDAVHAAFVNLCLPEGGITLTGATIPDDVATLNGGFPPDVWIVAMNSDPLDEDPPAAHFSGAIVIDTLSILGIVPPDPVELFRLEGVVEGTEGMVIPIELCDAVATFAYEEIQVRTEEGWIEPARVNGALTVLPPALFRRGDTNLDTTVDVADAITLLDVLFDPAPSSFPCTLAADANDDEFVDIGDPIALLNFLFGGNPAPLPLPVCGEDPTPGTLDCLQPASCPPTGP